MSLDVEIKMEPKQLATDGGTHIPNFLLLSKQHPLHEEGLNSGTIFPHILFISTFII